MANVELCNYFLGYVDDVIMKYSKIIVKDKISHYIFNSNLQKACNKVSFDWFNNNQKYKMIKTKDINALFNERKKYVYKKLF